MDENSHWRSIRIIEVSLVIVTAVTQYIYCRWTGTLDHLMMLSFAALGGMLVLSFVNLPDRRPFIKIICLLLQTILLSIACGAGAYRLFGLLFIALAAKAALTLGRTAMIGVVSLIAFSHVGLIAFMGHGFEQLHGQHRLQAGQQRFLRMETQTFFLAAVLIVTLLGRKILAEERARKSLERLSQELQEMAVALERMRIARDIHDGLGHTLTSLNIQLELTARLLQDKDIDRATESLASARTIARDSLNATRTAVRAVRGEGDFSLKQAVESMVERMNQQQQQRAFEILIDESAVTAPARDQLFCIVQECLTNVQKHSMADKVRIVLKQDNGRCELLVEDNGVGFESDAKEKGFGLLGIKERVESLGGSVKVESTPGQGTLVQLSVPI